MTTRNNQDQKLFAIRTASDAGIRIELTAPDGSETEHWLTVRGADSRAFTVARARSNREQMELFRTLGKDPDPGKVELEKSKITRRLIASLVADWSFEAECNVDNVSAFFRDAPQIQEQVDTVAGNRANFFHKPSPNSETSLDTASGSASEPTGANSPTEKPTNESAKGQKSPIGN